MTTLVATLCSAAFAQAPAEGSSATVTIKDGPDAGKYDAAPGNGCMLVAFGKQPLGVSAVFSGVDSSLSIDMPVLDEKHANEVQIVLVVQRKDAGKVSSVTYEIDTRPDASLAPAKKAERANKGMTGKAATTLLENGNTVMLSFTGTTATGVKLTGELGCRKVES